MIDREVRWAEVAGFPDYAVSNYGEVKSLRFDKILQPRVDAYGKLRVTLYVDRTAHDAYIHRLVAAAFIDGYEDGTWVKHRDGDPTNNFVYNLRFNVDQRMGQLVKDVSEPKFRRVMVTETGMIFRTVVDCANYIGGHASSIYRVLRGERPSHLGYTFQYVEESFNGA